jgi:hypothetical protein
LGCYADILTDGPRLRVDERLSLGLFGVYLQVASSTQAAHGEPPVDRNAIISELARLATAKPIGPFDAATDPQLIDILAQQPEFRSRERDLFYSGGAAIAFRPSLIVKALREIASEKGADAAVSWLERLLCSDTTKIRMISEIYGLEPPPGGVLVNEVTFIRASELPDSPRNRLMRPDLRQLIFH